MEIIYFSSDLRFMPIRNLRVSKIAGLKARDSTAQGEALGFNIQSINYKGCKFAISVV